MLDFLKSQLFTSVPVPTKSLAGKTIIITGANTGLGLEAARHCVRLDAAKVILAVRSEPKGQAAKEDIETSTQRSGVVEVWSLDLASYAAVNGFVEKIAQLPRVDAIIENAGIATMDWKVAEDNEQTITVNVVSTILLAVRMLPILVASAKKHPESEPVISIVTSDTHHWAQFHEAKAKDVFAALNHKQKADMLDRYVIISRTTRLNILEKKKKRIDGFYRYYTSKLLQILAVRALVERLQASAAGVTVNVTNPGFCTTSLTRDVHGLTAVKFKLLEIAVARSAECGSRVLVQGILLGPSSHGKYISDGIINE